jgi:hypothetical protein
MLDAAYPVAPLTWIKLLHTAIWFIFAGCVLILPVLGCLRCFRVAALLIGVVLVECVILAANHFRCPLTDLASRYTSERTANFDIYLPVWLVQRNQLIFGTLFSLASFSSRTAISLQSGQHTSERNLTACACPFSTQVHTFPQEIAHSPLAKI